MGRAIKALTVMLLVLLVSLSCVFQQMSTAITAFIIMLLVLLVSLSYVFLGFLLGWQQCKHQMHPTAEERIAISGADLILICTMICLKYDVRRDGKKILPTELDQYIQTVTTSVPLPWSCTDLAQRLSTKLITKDC